MARVEEIQLAKTPKTWRSAHLAWLTAKRWYLINPGAKFKSSRLHWGSQQRSFSRMRSPWGPCIGKALPLPLYELEGAINGWTSYSSICQAQDDTLDDIGDSRGLGVGARTLWRWNLMD